MTEHPHAEPTPGRATERCCCGRVKDFSETLIINDCVHERLGEPGAFCGPVYKHEMRDLAAERDKLAGELQHVDAVLARRPALDDKPTRIDKILHALETAAERDRLVKVNEGLVKALEEIAEAAAGSWVAGKARAALAEAQKQ